MLVRGEGKVFYSAEEVNIALNEKKIDIHAQIKIRVTNALDGVNLVTKVIETTAGRVMFNQVVPHEVGFINELLTKKSLRDIIGMVVKKTGMAKTAKFLDDIKDLGFKTAFKGGLSFNLGDIETPAEKFKIIKDARAFKLMK
jgi:DNA-directed RNA polymerase subunit beta'